MRNFPLTNAKLSVDKCPTRNAGHSTRLTAPATGPAADAKLGETAVDRAQGRRYDHQGWTREPAHQSPAHTTGEEQVTCKSGELRPPHRVHYTGTLRWLNTWREEL